MVDDVILDKFQVIDGHPSYEGLVGNPVDWDEHKVVRDGSLLWTDSLASCLAVTLYDVQNKVGALAHISGFDDSPDGMRPERIVNTLLEGLGIFANLVPQDLEATLSGEGMGVGGDRISDIVRKSFQSYKIPIIGEDLSEGFSRLAFLYDDIGRVEVYRI